MEDAEIIGKAMGAPPEALEGLLTGNAWVRVMHKGQPHRSPPIETDKAELKTRWLEPNIRHTRANWSRPRAALEARRQRRRAAW